MGRASAIESEVVELTEKVAQSLGLELYDLVFKRSGPRWKLQVFVDKNATVGSGTGVSLDECASFSRQLSRELDVLDPIPYPYDLEVSSPGLERTIRSMAHWNAALGKRVRVRWRTDEGKARSDIGTLELLDQDDPKQTRISLRMNSKNEQDEQHLSIPMSSVLSARVHIDW